MLVLAHSSLTEIDILASYLRPRRRSLRDRVIGRFSIGQILTDQLLYEVHGPFEIGGGDTPGPRRSRIGSLLERLAAVAREIARYSQSRRAVADLSGLDDRMLRDIGLARSEIEAAANGLLGHRPLH